jgi:hypothetical protein
MSSVVLSRQFNISGLTYSNCYNGSALSNGVYSIPNFVSKTDDIENIYVSVSHCEIPNSFYLINKHNNTLHINSTYYYLPYGNYNVSSLITAMLLILPLTFSITYNTIYKKYTILNSSGNFSIDNNKSTITRIIGLGLTGTIVATPFSSGYLVQLPNCVNFLPTPRVNIRSNKMKLQNFSSYDSSSDILTSVQNNASQSGMITFINYTKARYKIDVESINDLDIRITDDSNNDLDFNGVDWYIAIKVDYEYKLNYVGKKDAFSKILENNNEFLNMMNDEN